VYFVLLISIFPSFIFGLLYDAMEITIPPVLPPPSYRSSVTYLFPSNSLPDFREIRDMHYFNESPSKRGFRRNRASDSRTLLTRVNEFISLFFKFVFKDLCENPCRYQFNFAGYV